MKLSKIIADEFKRQTINGTNFDYYTYDFNEQSIPQGITLHGNTSLERNLSLRNSLHTLWVKGSVQTRYDIASYYVRTWGGIHRINEDNLRAYTDRLSNGEFPPNKNIASWTKIASVADPEQYAIFDSRVSAALTCLQILHGVHECNFPLLPSRNVTVQSFHRYIRVIRAQPGNCPCCTDSDFYRKYLCIIKEAAGLANTSIQHIEMFLFSIAITKITEVIDNHH